MDAAFDEADAYVSDTTPSPETHYGRGPWTDARVSALAAALRQKGATYGVVGRQFGISDVAVFQAAQKYGLGHFRRGKHSIPNKMEAVGLLWVRAYSVEDICEIARLRYANRNSAKASLGAYAPQCVKYGSERTMLLRKLGGPRSMAPSRKARLISIFNNYEGKSLYAAVREEFEKNP